MTSQKRKNRAAGGILPLNAVTIVVGIIILLAVVLIFKGKSDKSDAPQAAAPAAAAPAKAAPGAGGPPAEQKPPEVAVLTLKAQTALLYEELPGRTAAYKVAEIRPQVSGIITERLFEEGSSVKEGQQLYQVDPSVYKATLDSAYADLKKAQANVTAVTAKSRRYEELVKIDAISRQEYDDVQGSLAQAQADVAIAQAAIAGAKINLNYTKVYAPIAGRIGKSSFTKGALVTNGQAAPLATITQLDPVYVDMTQSSADLMRLRQKMEENKNVAVTLVLDEDKKNTYDYEGTLQFHEVTVDPTTGSVQLRALFPNPDNILLPGLFVRARLKLEYANTLLVPQKAASRNPDGSISVWVVQADNTVQPVPIQVDRAVDGKWVVTSGLKDGDRIAMEGFMAMKPGAMINPLPETPALGAASPAAPTTNGG